jgi:hypothetical protein
MINDVLLTATVVDVSAVFCATVLFALLPALAINATYLCVFVVFCCHGGWRGLLRIVIVRLFRCFESLLNSVAGLARSVMGE